ncbi:hypothetical protein DL770_006008 [Monosporascus sp. CRB-9-2]|nr:hypothetical protein DL770_006008 [Monosporascus sp. CRB-9-2]
MGIVGLRLQPAALCGASEGRSVAIDIEGDILRQALSGFRELKILLVHFDGDGARVGPRDRRERVLECDSRVPANTTIIQGREDLIRGAAVGRSHRRRWWYSHEEYDGDAQQREDALDQGRGNAMLAAAVPRLTSAPKLVVETNQITRQYAAAASSSARP